MGFSLRKKEKVFVLTQTRAFSLGKKVVLLCFFVFVDL